MNPITYLDNAATTRLDETVLEAMLPYLKEHYGNPSSSYSLGRKTRIAIEQSRAGVAKLLGAKATNIYFTSGGTESNNTAITAAVHDLGCTHIISSPLEHHAVIHTIEHQLKRPSISYSNVKTSRYGDVDLSDLENQLAEKFALGIKCLVSLMHANNEIGTLLPIKEVGAICARYDAIFHSDCVQTIGHYQMNLKDYGVHFAAASGHKFHGPKGTGILYVADGIDFNPLIHGGGQERKKRAGTENVHGMIGFAKALEIAMENYAVESVHMRTLNNNMRAALSAMSPEITFNSTYDSLYTVLSVNFPDDTNGGLLLALLDAAGICASGGSACSSGDKGGSHVIGSILPEAKGATLRFSFSKMTTQKDIDTAVDALAKILKLSPVV